jgi:hypothetical protein
MIRTRIALAVLAITGLAGCGAPAAPSESASTFAFGSRDDARELPAPAPGDPAEMRPGANGGVILDPTSVPIEHRQPYQFNLGHCGLSSPVDLDGSFWDEVELVDANGQPIDRQTDTEMINASTGVVIVIGDDAFFRTELGSVVTFRRHEGEKEFPPCM